MKSFNDRINLLNRDQLLILTKDLYNEINNFRPEHIDEVQNEPANSLYEIQWEQKDIIKETNFVEASKNLVYLWVLCDNTQDHQAIELYNNKNNISSEFVYLSKTGIHFVNNKYLDVSSNSWSEIFEIVLRSHQKLDAVIIVPSYTRVPPADIAFQSKYLVWEVNTLVRELILHIKIKLKIWIITHNAQSLPSDQELPFLEQAPLIGWSKALGLEQPNLQGGTIDVDQPLSDEYLELITNEIRHNTKNDEIVLRKGIRWIPKLIHKASFSMNYNISSIISKNATYLITGATGGIGSSVVDSLIAQGVEHFIFLEKHSEKEYLDQPDKFHKKIECFQKWRDQSIEFTIYKVELNNEKQVISLVSLLKKLTYPLTGIFHLAGFNDIKAIQYVDKEYFASVMQAKIDAAWNLHSLSMHFELNLFVLFSSIAAVWGSANMTIYAAANRFLMSLSEYRLRKNLPNSNINWGAWGEVGMMVNKQQVHMETFGLHLFSIKEGIRLFNIALSNKMSNPVIANISWVKYLEIFPYKSLNFFSKVVGKLDNLSATINEPILIKNLIGVSKQQQLNLIKEHLIIIIAQMLNCDVTNIDPLKPMHELGLGSLMSIELRNHLKQQIKLDFSPTLIFDFPTINHLAEEISAQLNEQNENTSNSKTMCNKSANNNEPIAIIGIGCRFPQARSWQEYWDNLIQGIDSVSEGLDSRFNNDIETSDYVKSKILNINLNAGFIEDIDKFDYQLFDLNKKEADFMDPQQRLALEVAWTSLEDAGYAPLNVEAKKTGIFLGVGSNEYGVLGRNYINSDYAGLMATGQSLNVIPGRIAYTFGFTGPAIAFDTACSSSLVAVHSAIKSLQAFESDMALAGGINTLLSLENFYILSQAKMLSSSGHCHVLDEKADGYVRGEGCGIIVLKRLSDAQRNNDKIYAIIKGSAVNQDGRSSSLTAPNTYSQQDVMKQALEASYCTAEEISLIEMHGTGTPLGDPIEFQSITKVYLQNRSADNILYLNSVKANIGHAEAAAGIAGLIKLALSIYHKQIPSQIHFEKLNPNISTLGDAAHIPEKSIPWESSNNKLLGAVNSFGFSGTNSHVILEQAPLINSTQTKLDTFECNLFTISGASNQALVAIAREYLNLELSEQDMPLVCYSTNISRSHLKYRFSIICNSRYQLTSNLEKFLVSYKDADSVITKLKGKLPKFIFIIPDMGVSEQLREPLSQQYPAYKFEINALRERIRDAKIYNIVDHDIQQFIYTYSLIKILIDLNIQPHKIYGLGRSIYIAFAISGVMSIEEALNNYINGQQYSNWSTVPEYEITSPLDGESIYYGLNTGSIQLPNLLSMKRMDAFVIKNTLQDPLNYIIDFSLNTDYSHFGRGFNHSSSSFEMVLSMLSQAFNLGVDINFQKLYTGKIYKKTLLPYYIFDKKRCWYNLEDNNLSLKNQIPVTNTKRLLYTIDWEPYQSLTSIHLSNTWRLYDEETDLFEKVTDLTTKSLAKLILNKFARYEKSSEGISWQNLGANFNLLDMSTSNLVLCIPEAINDLSKEFIVDTQVTNLLNCIEFMLSIFKNILTKFTSKQQLKLIIITRGICVTKHETTLPNIFSSPLIGLIKTALVEHPELNIKLIDLDPDISWLSDHVLMEIAQSNENIFAIRQNKLLVSRLNEIKTIKNSKLIVNSKQTHVITGAFGSLGLEICYWLLSQGAKFMIMVGRSDPTHDTLSKITLWEQQFQAKILMIIDNSNFKDLKFKFANSINNLPPICGVFHCAGSILDAALLNQSKQHFDKVFMSKITGTWNVHHFTADMKLDYFVMFSSISAVLGNWGQANYAAANTFLDCFATYRKRLGLPATSINWGPWANIGMAARNDIKRHYALLDIGIETIDVNEAIHLMETLVAYDEPQIIAVKINWNKYLNKKINTYLLGNLSIDSNTTYLLTKEINFKKTLSGLHFSSRKSALFNFLKTQLAQCVGIENIHELDDKRGFSELGMTSIQVLIFRQQLENQLDLSLSSTIIYDYPDLTRLTEHLTKNYLSNYFQEKTEQSESDDLNHLTEEQLLGLLAQQINHSIDA